MKYTEEQKQEVVLMLQQQAKIAEISELTQIPASTIYRWRSEQAKQPGASGTELAQFRVEVEKRLEDLNQQVLDLCTELANLQDRWAPAIDYVLRLQRQDAKRREQSELDSPGTFKFKLAGAQ